MAGKEITRTGLSPTFFTDISTANTPSKKGYSYDPGANLKAAGGMVKEVSKAVSDYVADYDKLKLTTFEGMVNQEHKKYLQEMQLTTDQDQRDKLTEEYKNNIAKIARKNLNGRQIGIWDRQFQEGFNAVIEEDYTRESILGLRRENRALGVRVSENLIDKISGDDNQFKNINKEFEAISETLQKYYYPEEFEAYKNSFYERAFTRKAYKDSDNGRSKEVIDELKKGNDGKYKIAKDATRVQLMNYAQRIYDNDQQNEIAMNAMTEYMTGDGNINFEKALDSLNSGKLLSKGYSIDNINGARSRILSYQSTQEGNQRILRENTLQGSYYTAWDVYNKRGLSSTLDYISSQQDLSSRDAEWLKSVFMNAEKDKAGPGQKHGLAYYDILKRIYSGEIVKIEDTEIFTLAADGKLFDTDIPDLQNALGSVIKSGVGTLEKEAIANLDTALEALNVIDPGVKEILIRNLHNEFIQTSNTDKEGRDKLIALSNYSNMVVWTKNNLANASNQISDALAQNDIMRTRTEAENAVKQGVADLQNYLATGEIDVKEFDKRVRELYKVNQYKIDGKVQEWTDLPNVINQIRNDYGIPEITQDNAVDIITNDRGMQNAVVNMVNKLPLETLKTITDNYVKGYDTIAGAVILKPSEVTIEAINNVKQAIDKSGITGAVQAPLGDVLMASMLTYIRGLSIKDKKQFLVDVKKVEDKNYFGDSLPVANRVPIDQFVNETLQLIGGNSGSN